MSLISKLSKVIDDNKKELILSDIVSILSNDKISKSIKTLELDGILTRIRDLEKPIDLRYGLLKYTTISILLILSFISISFV